MTADSYTELKESAVRYREAVQGLDCRKNQLGQAVRTKWRLPASVVRFLADESAQSFIECALVGLLIAVVVLLCLLAFVKNV